ncbi:MAG: winged helix-turn-helix transcriptional regulator, partial [Anaerolineae bacterium]|nr:winged helix-turn-helix transcriptional regulator [Anaerolineae bacterium]
MPKNLSPPFIKLIDRDLYLNGNANAIKLTPKEARLMSVFLNTPNAVVSRATLMRKVWETDFLDDTRTLDVHI